MEKERDLSRLSDDFAQDIRTIYTMSGNISAVTTSSLEEWKIFLEEYLGRKEFLITREMIQSKIDKIAGQGDFSAIFPQGHRCVVGIIPCDAFGSRYTAEDISAGEHIVLLVAPHEQNLSPSHFRYANKLMMDFLPREISQECGFDIGEYNSSPDGDSTEAVREKARIISLYARALNNLAGRFNKRD